MYQVLARKWRPQTLDSLVGQSHVARTLRNAIEGGRIAHAYVFAGLRGTGKTSVARILAKSLNCEHGPTAAPCNRCASCVEIMEGRSLDVMEIDAASHTGVDNIRELQEVVAYAPVRDRYRILIIDEAHMLSKAAFNALLKTLEEPPAHLIFVLATTEPQKLPSTILSRCQVFEFHRVPAKSVAAHLRHVADGEGITISDRTLERVARAGEGSLRDALTVLERVLAFCGSVVPDEDALQVLGAIRTEVLVGFVAGIAARDSSALLQSLDALIDDGHDLVQFWSELVGVVRDLMLVRAWPSGEAALSRPPDEAHALLAAAGDLTLHDWVRVFQILAGIEFALKSSSQPRFIFEGALIRIASLGSVRPIEDVLASLGGGLPAAPGAPAKPAPAPAAPKSRKAEPAPATGQASQPSSGFGDAREALLSAVAGARPMLGGILQKAASIVIDGGTIRVTFAPADIGIRRLLESEDNARSIEAIASQAFGRPFKLHLGDGIGNPEPEADPAKPEESRDDLASRARKDPMIGRLLTEFGAQVVDVRPLPQDPADTGPPGQENG